MSNPYKPPQQLDKEHAGAVPFRTVSIRPIDRLYQAKALLGEQYWLFVGITLVGVIIGSAVPFGILMGPMMCGIYLCYRSRMDQVPARFDQLFKGFDYFLESFLAMLVVIAISLVVVVPFYVVAFVGFMFAAGAAESTDGVSLAVMFVVLPVSYVLIILLVAILMAPCIFIFPLIVDQNLGAWDAVKVSFRAVMANFGGVVGMIIIYYLISVAGSCACYVPAILFMPLSMGAAFLVYRDVFNPQSAED